MWIGVTILQAEPIQHMYDAVKGLAKQISIRNAFHCTCVGDSCTGAASAAGELLI